MVEEWVAVNAAAHNKDQKDCKDCKDKNPKTKSARGGTTSLFVFKPLGGGAPLPGGCECGWERGWG